MATIPPGICQNGRRRYVNSVYDARPKTQRRPDAQMRYELQTQTPSLDGRITGRTRTCWFETLCQRGAAPTQPACEPSALRVDSIDPL